MYYHDIAFGAQARFFLISFAAGLIAGCFALLLCAKPLKGALRFMGDIVFCLICVLLVVCNNIVFQEGALRVYEVIAFLIALASVVIILKKKSDKAAVKVSVLLQKILFLPLTKLFKHIMNNIKKLLKKARRMVYNFTNKSKEHLKRNAEKYTTKKEKKKKAGKTAS